MLHKITEQCRSQGGKRLLKQKNIHTTDLSIKIDILA
jgi:hypothetical protein